MKARLPYRDEVVDLEDHADALGGEVQRGCVDEERLDHILLVHVRDDAVLDVDAGVDLAAAVPLAQLGDDVDGVQAGVFGQRVWDHLQCLRKRGHAVALHARHRLGEVGELQAGLDLRCASTGDDEAFLHERPHDAERVVDAAVRLLQDQLVRPAHQDGHREAGPRHADALDDLLVRPGHAHLVHELGGAQLLRGHVVDVGHGQQAQRVGDEFDLAALDVRDAHDAHLGQEMQREVVVRVAKDRFLDEQNVAPRLFDLLAEAEDVLALLAQEAVHGRVIRNDNIVLHVCLRCAQAELDQANLRLFHARRPARGLAHALREDDAVDELRVVDGAAELLHNLDVRQVHRRDTRVRRRAHHGQDGVDGDGRQRVRVLRHDLRRQARHDGVDQRRPVLQRHGPRNRVLEDALRLVGGEHERLSDGRRVQALCQQLVARVEQRPRDDAHRCRAVARLNVLRLGQLHEHLRRRVLDFHLGEDGGAVVGDDDLAVAGLDHLVHTARAQRRANRVGNALGGHDVRHAHILLLLQPALRLAVPCAARHGWRSGERGGAGVGRRRAASRVSWCIR
mmetsp:Transcript_30051/g.103833  ORF Transcript_30051/g.103833 Transcript_30051/m.103833 type:complete len:565 (-) Transcript_30051:9-1703(-)